MVFGFAAIGACIALLPSGSFVLPPLELVMLYRIADKHGAFELPTFLAMGAAITMLSVALKGLASILHALPIIGQIANSLVAGVFILFVGIAAEKYYSSRRRY